MKILTRTAVSVGFSVLLITLLLPPADAGARPLRGPGLAEVIIEGSAIQPFGDLAADWTEPAGLQAGQGWDVGFRFRQRWPAGWAISPSFHYVDFGNYLAENQTDGLMDVGGKMYRYGVDLQYFFPSGRNQPKLFMSFGAALVRNKVRTDYLDLDEYSDEGANSIAAAAGLGIRMGNFEISGEYNMNRVRSTRFILGIEDHNWDYAVLRVGIALPSSY